eukprot:scaffold1771_cov197-Skeletonema_marinoi.AAC.3
MDPKKADLRRSKLSIWAAYFNLRMMPHGGAILLPIILVTTGWVASLTHDGCDYARLTGPAVEILTGSSSIPYIHIGLSAYRVPQFYPASNSWRVAYSSDCRPYSHPEILEDRAWVASEWLNFSGIVIGGTVMMFLWSGTCLTLRKKYWMSIGVGALLACLLQMCSFVFFKTKLCHTSTKTFLDFEAGREIELSEASASSSCSLFFASKCAIASICLWLAAGLVILMGEYPRPVPKLIAHDDDERAAMIRQRNPPRFRTRMTARPNSQLNNSQHLHNSQQLAGQNGSLA